MRWGVGPVFACESVLRARRWQVYAARSLFVLVLLVGIACISIFYTRAISRSRGAVPNNALTAAIGKAYFYALTGSQVSLILLAAPAAAAGSLGTDRSRATLLQMMVTDLSDTEIVLGTLAARLAPVLALIAAAVPVTALAALLGGIDSAALTGALVVSLALAILGCVLALTISVWVTKTHEVLLAVYSAESVWLVAAPVWSELAATGIPGPPAWFWKTHPYVLAFAPYWRPGYAGAADFVVFVAGVLLFSTALAGLVIARLRAIVVGQASRSASGSARRWSDVAKIVFPSWRGPTLDGNPALWREWHRGRPSRLARMLATSFLSLAWVFAAYGTWVSITRGTSEGSGPLAGGISIALLFGFLILAATAPTALSDERTHGTLDVLLAAPLATREIVIAKWWGVYRWVLVMLPLFIYVAGFEALTVTDMPNLPASVVASQGYVPLTPAARLLGAIFCPLDFLASGAVLVSIGVALATWCRRTARAVMLSVIAFFLLGLVWPTLAEVGFALVLFWVRSGQDSSSWLAEHRFLEESLAALSPIAGPIAPLNALRWNPDKGFPFWMGLGVVIAIKTVGAWLLLQLTIRTFDRCLGRVRDSGAISRSQSTSPHTFGDWKSAGLGRAFGGTASRAKES
jgi:ABC-type transport system involved in multi-copper enzyme maturation permease subunit